MEAQEWRGWTYFVKINDEPITFGPRDNLSSQTRFRDRVAEKTGHLVPKMPGAEWGPVALGMVDACEEMPMEEASQYESGETSQWVEEYLAENPITDEPNRAAVTNQPLRKGGEIYIHLKNFQHWIEQKHGRKLSRNKFAVTLREVGAEPVSIDVMVGGRRGSRNLWMVP